MSVHSDGAWDFGVPGIFDNIRDGLVLVRFPGREIVLFNRAASSIFGVPIAKALGMRVDLLFQDPAVVRQATASSKQPVGQWPGHDQLPMMAHIAGASDLTDVEVQFCRVEDAGVGGPLVLFVVRPGAVSELAAVARKAASDLATMSDHGQKVQARVQELESKANAQALFFSQAAHEFNTPLTVVLLQSKLLHKALGPLSPKQEQALARIDTNVHRLVLLSQDLLDLARADAGRLLLSPVKLDLAELVKREARNFLELAKEQRVTLKVTPLPRPAPVKGEAMRLRQVLANFIGNAVKFTPAGGRVGIRLEQRDGQAWVTITDNGRGMDAQDVDRLFQPFMRIDDPDLPKKPGSGLGLYISKRIVEAHGGEVHARSLGRGKGMELAFGLPLVEAVQRDASQRVPQRRRPSSGKRRTHAPEDAKEAVATSPRGKRHFRHPGKAPRKPRQAED